MTTYDHATMPRHAGVATPHAASPRSPLPGAARWYARRGFPLVPLHHVLPDGACSCTRGAACERAGKHPRTRHGVLDATTDEAQIAAWWRQWPEANIGAATGVLFDVLDLDVTDLERWQRETGYRVPITWHARSGKGGHHLYFEPAPDLGNGVRRLPFADTRSKGGYIVLPPSRSAAGAYCWKTAPGAVPLVPWPVGLLGALRAPDRPAPSMASRPAGLVARIPASLERWAAQGAPAGERNARAFWLACRLRQHGADDTEALAILERFAAACTPPLALDEVRCAWRSSARHQGFDPCRRLPDPSRPRGRCLPTPCRPPARRIEATA